MATTVYERENCVADFKIKPVLVLISFFLETMRLVKFELFYLFELRIGSICMITLEVRQGII